MALAICTNVGKMTGYLVIGASRAVLQKTLATGDNLGEITTKLGTLGMLMHCFGAATALTLIHHLGFWVRRQPAPPPPHFPSCQFLARISLCNVCSCHGIQRHNGLGQGQLGAIGAGAVAGFYAPVRASQCVVMSAVTFVSLRRLVKRWAEQRRRRQQQRRVPEEAAAAAAAAAAPWVCPSPEQLHDELAARWSFVYSLAARASVWREVALADTGAATDRSHLSFVQPLFWLSFTYAMPTLTC
jgi:hypothetical protein